MNSTFSTAGLIFCDYADWLFCIKFQLTLAYTIMK